MSIWSRFAVETKAHYHEMQKICPQIRPEHMQRKSPSSAKAFEEDQRPRRAFMNGSAHNGDAAGRS